MDLRLIKAKKKERSIICLNAKSNEANPLKDKEPKKQ